MQHFKRIIFSIILLIGFCGVGYLFLQKRSELQMPSTFAQAQPDVGRIAYLNEGKLLLVHSNSGENSLWDTASKQKVGDFHALGTIWISADGRQMVFENPVRNSISTHLIFVRLSQGKSTFYHLQQDHDITTRDVQYHIRDISPDFSKLLASVTSHDVLLIDTNSGKVLSRRDFPVKYLPRPCFSKSSRFVLLGGTPKNALLFNAADLSVYRKFPELNHFFLSLNDNTVYGVRIEADGITSHIQILDLKTGRKTEQLSPLRNIVDISQLSDGNIYVHGIKGNPGQGHIVELTDKYSQRGKLLRELNSGWADARSQDQQWSGEIISPHSNTPVPSASPFFYEVRKLDDDKILHRLNITDDPLRNDTFSYLLSYFGQPYSAISPDKSQIAIATPDGLIRFYDFPSDDSSLPNLYKSNSSGQIIARTDSQYIADYKVANDGSVSIQSGHNSLHNNYESAWSNDNQLEAATADYGVVNIQNRRQQPIAYVSGTSPLFKKSGMNIERIAPNPASLAISPDKSFLAAGRADGTIYLYSLKTCLPVAQIGNAPEQVMNIKFSPDGHTLYGLTNHKVRSWDVPAIKP